MKYLYWNIITSRDPGDFVISGVGIREPMRPVIVDRPEGTGDCLLMFFYNPVILETAGRRELHEAGTLMLWGRGKGHYYGSSNNKWSHSWLHFHGNICDDFLQKCGLEDDSCFILKKPEILEEYLIKIYNEIMDHNSAEMLQLYWKCLFTELGRQKNTLTEKEPPDSLAAVREYLVQYPENRDSIYELARKAGMSVPNFCALFHRWFGKSPGQFRLDARMERACYYLRFKTYTIKEIGRLVGYDDAYQFSRIFSRHTGMSPSRWRGN